MENIAGKYKFDGQENFDEFLKAQGNIFFIISKYSFFFKYLSLGIGMIKRKAVASFKPETTITVNGNKFTFENTTPLKTTRKTEFTLDEAFEVDLMGNGEKKTYINSLSGNVLTTKDMPSGKVVAIRTFNADGFSMKMIGPNDVTAVRHFKRV